MNDVILVTGGAGFIGSKFVLQWSECDDLLLRGLVQDVA
jgi:nucleoside-diphosphate-sugar epimerase